MLPLSIGLSGLTVNQRLLDLAGQNVTNANNPAYHRQDATLAARVHGAPPGDGVEITQVRRLISDVLEAALNRSTFQASDTTQQLESLHQLQATLDTGDGSLHDALETFFNEAEKLTVKPDDGTQRRVVLAAAQALTDRLNDNSQALISLGHDLDVAAQQAVGEVNDLAKQVAALNLQIRDATLRNVPANDLLDQRDDLITQIAQRVDVRTLDQDNGQRSVIVAGLPLVIGSTSTALQYNIDAKNQAVILPAGSTVPLPITGGQLGGILTVRNELLPQYQNVFRDFADQLVRSLDETHAQGLGLTGPFTQLSGARPVKRTDVPLAQAGLAYPPQAGTLYVSVTNFATGQRTLSRIDIDPATQSLQDVAAAISAVPNLQAVTDPQSGKLVILARPGFGFDFAGRLPTAPTSQAITGTSAPRVSGQYTGSANDTLTWTTTGSGTVGVTPGLTLELRNAAGTLLATQNIGAGYEPGTDLPAVQGVTAALAVGTVNAGDTFAVQAVGQPDSANLLTALGLNTLFVGDQPTGLHVQPDLLASPERFALSKSGATGDGTNLRALVAARDQRVAAGGTQTLRESLEDLTGRVASRIHDLELQQTAQQSLSQRLQDERQAASGVDPNEELVRMLQYQRGFQTSARYISVVNDTLDELVHLV